MKLICPHLQVQERNQKTNLIGFSCYGGACPLGHQEILPLLAIAQQLENNFPLDSENQGWIEI